MKIKELCTKNKKKIIIVSISLATVLVTAGGAAFYCLRKNGEVSFPFGQGGMTGSAVAGGEMVSAYGVTSVGMTQVKFEVENLETQLEIEEVYVSSSQEIEEGTAILKLSEESVAEAREELESELREADLSYRAGAIEYEQSRITAAYERDDAILDGEQASEVYDQTVAGLKASVERAQEELDAAKESIAEYQEALGSNSLYEYYRVEEYKDLYDENLKLLTDKMSEWGVSWSQVIVANNAGNSAGSTGSSAGSTGSSTGSIGSSAGSTGSSAGSTGSSAGSTGSSAGSTGSSAGSTGSSAGSTGSSARSIGSDSVDNGILLTAAASEDIAANAVSVSVSGGDASDLGTAGSGTGSIQNSSGSDSSGYVTALRTLYSVLEQNLSDYEQAKSDYEDAAANAEFELQTLELSLPSLENALAEAKENYESSILEAKLTYETALANAARAESDYEATIEKAETDYEALREAREDAQENLELFESSVGEGIYYASGSGTILRTMVREGDVLTSDSTIFIYSNPDEMTVTVSVGQEDIARIAVGDSAFIQSGDYGVYQGTVSQINPVSSSDSRTSVTYSVIVALSGDTGELATNETVTVIFGMGGNANE